MRIVSRAGYPAWLCYCYPPVAPRGLPTSLALITPSLFVFYLSLGWCFCILIEVSFDFNLFADFDRHALEQLLRITFVEHTHVFSMQQELSFNLHNFTEYYHSILSNHKYSIRILLCKCCCNSFFVCYGKELVKMFYKKFAYKVRLSTSTTCSRRRMARDCRLKFTFASIHPIFCFWSSSEVHKRLTRTLSHAMKYIRESEWACIGLRVCMQGFYFTKDPSSRSFLLYCNRQVAFGRRRRRKLGIW